MATHRSRTSRIALAIALASLMVLALLVAAPAGADDGSDDLAERVASMRAAAAVGSADSVRAAQQDDCQVDADGDTTNFETGDPQPQPRADIIEFCVRYGPTLALTVRADEPTDPEEDVNWTGGTFVGWFLDIDGDGEGDFFVDYSLDRDGALNARVSDVRDAEPAVTCEDEVTAAYTGWFSVSGIDPGCIDDADEVAASVALFYDTSPTADDGAVYTDTAPGGDAFTAGVETTGPRATARHASSDRVETSVEISKAQFADPADATSVYIARADEFPDAVAGGVLSDGPILLVNFHVADPVPAVVRDEIARLDPDRVFALGGPAAVPQSVLDEAAGARTQGRLAGDTRIETAVAISQEEFPDPADVDEVFLARSDLFADAVAGGSLTTGPVLLVPQCGPLPAAVRNEINRLGPSEVTALGGPDAICDELLLDAAGDREAARLAGATRIETSIEIARYEFPDAADRVYLARSEEPFADAVTGGVLTAGPTLLVPPCRDLPESVGGEISRLSPQAVVALGGPLAICDAVLNEAAEN